MTFVAILPNLSTLGFWENYVFFKAYTVISCFYSPHIKSQIKKFCSDFSAGISYICIKKILLLQATLKARFTSE